MNQLQLINSITLTLGVQNYNDGDEEFADALLI